MPTNPKSLEAHLVTGLVPIEFLGVPIDGGDGRAGEAGLGLRVGEVRGVAPEIAARMIDLGTARAVKPVVDGAAAPKPAGKPDAPKPSA